MAFKQGMIKKKLFGILRRCFIFIFILAGCSPSGIAENRASISDKSTAIPSPVIETNTAPVLTNTSQPIMTPSIVSSLTSPDENPDEQIYIDPGGVYTLVIPVSWQQEAGTNRFVGQDGFVESGILPDKAYMRYALQVCQWIANIDQKGNASVGWINFVQSCLVTPITEDENPAVIAIIQNPNGSPENKFVYIEADLAHYSYFVNQIQWVNMGKSQTEKEQQFLQAREDEFWAEITSSDSDLKIREYLLPAEAQMDSPGKTIFLEYIPEEVRVQKSGSSSGNTRQIPSWENFNQSVSAYGYEFRKIEESGFYEMYYQGELITKGVHKLPTLHRFSTPAGERIVFIVESIIIDENSSQRIKSQTRYLAENEGIIKWEEGMENPMGTSERIILVNDDLLWARIGDHTNVEIQNKNHDVLFSFSTYFGTQIPINGFRSWNGHWILEVSDFVIIDGEILNETFGYEEIYRWMVINEKPFYFFRNGAQSGMSYDDQILPIAYDEIIHGYCCGLALNNPRLNEDEVRFFAKKDGLWYYVIIEL